MHRVLQVLQAAAVAVAVMTAAAAAAGPGIAFLKTPFLVATEPYSLYLLHRSSCIEFHLHSLIYKILRLRGQLQG